MIHIKAPSIFKVKAIAERNLYIFMFIIPFFFSVIKISSQPVATISRANISGLIK